MATIDENRKQLISKIKVSMRITTNAFDTEINDLIDAAFADMGMADVVVSNSNDKPVIYRAIVTYCRMHFGQPDDYDRLKASYDEQKAQLSMSTDYGDYSMLSEDE